MLLDRIKERLVNELEGVHLPSLRYRFNRIVAEEAMKECNGIAIQAEKMIGVNRKSIANYIDCSVSEWCEKQDILRKSPGARGRNNEKL